MSTATSTTWNLWCASSSCTSTASSSDAYTWGTWNDSTATSSAASSTTTDSYTYTTTWVAWNEDYEHEAVRVRQQPGRIEREEFEAEREERLAELRRQRAESRRRAEEFKKEKKESEERAKQLLLDLIGEEDLAVYEDTGRLFVKGRKYDYIVQRRGYIKRIEKDKITDMCVHLDNRSRFPETDNVVAMKLALENEEDKMLEMCNLWGSMDKPKKLPKAACM